MGISFPSFVEVYQAVEGFVEKNPEIAELESIASTEDRREVKAVHISDKKLPRDKKEVVVVVSGRHGNELGTRTFSIGLLEWLASEKAERIRKRQHIILVPIANPDGAAKNEFYAPFGRLSKLEKKITTYLAEVYKPDVLVDVHSLWYSDVEAVIDGHTEGSAEDDMIHGTLAYRMVKKAEEEGYPFLTTDHQGIRRILKRLSYNNFLCEAFYERIHSLVFGLELNHFSLSPEQVSRSGIACVKALLNVGNEGLPWQRNAGYPNRILIGDLFTSIRARGRNPGEKRDSRIKLWTQRNKFKRLERRVEAPNKLKISFEYSGEKLNSGLDLSFRLRGNPSLQKIELNGNKIDTYYTFSDSASIYVSVPIYPLEKGTYEISANT
ncbi:MAG: hypothetical protein GWO20_05565 [Candidatus Korarchaeota archaeon]|nr:hypothetical protein [Candidatus Korarchaeota archaeon]